MRSKLVSRVAKLGTLATAGILFGGGCNLNQLALFIVESLGGVSGLVDVVLDLILTGTGTSA